MDGRNYVHKLQLVQRNVDTCESPHSLVKQSFSTQLSGLPSSNGVSDSNDHSKINRKISLPVFNTNPPPVVDGREVCYVHILVSRYCLSFSVVCVISMFIPYACLLFVMYLCTFMYGMYIQVVLWLLLRCTGNVS